MTKRFTMLAVTMLFAGCMAWAAGNSWKGVVSDEHCGAKHSEASAGAAACVAKCAAGGAKYVLVSDGKVYQLDPQDKFKDMGGKEVTVKGSMTGDSITATSVKAAGGKMKAAEKTGS